MAETDVMANTLERFNGDISDFEGAYSKFISDLNALLSHMKELGSMWEGEAYEQLQSTFETDANKATELGESLNGICGKLKYAYDEYTSCENSVADILNSMNV